MGFIGILLVFFCNKHFNLFTLIVIAFDTYTRTATANVNERNKLLRQILNDTQDKKKLFLGQLNTNYIREKLNVYDKSNYHLIVFDSDCLKNLE